MDIYALTTQEILDNISRHCPEAMSTFLHCLNRADSNGKIRFDKMMVDVDMSEEWHVFRRNIKKLARENLIIWSPTDEGLEVQLIDIHENE